MHRSDAAQLTLNYRSILLEKVRGLLLSCADSFIARGLIGQEPNLKRTVLTISVADHSYQHLLCWLQYYSRNTYRGWPDTTPSHLEAFERRQRTWNTRASWHYIDWWGYWLHWEYNALCGTWLLKTSIAKCNASVVQRFELIVTLSCSAITTKLQYKIHTNNQMISIM